MTEQYQMTEQYPVLTVLTAEPFETEMAKVYPYDGKKSFWMGPPPESQEAADFFGKLFEQLDIIYSYGTRYEIVRITKNSIIIQGEEGDQIEININDDDIILNSKLKRISDRTKVNLLEIK